MTWEEHVAKYRAIQAQRIKAAIQDMLEPVYPTQHKTEGLRFVMSVINKDVAFNEIK